jgi:predicted phosphodiesterase
MHLQRIALLGDIHAEDAHLALALERVRDSVDAVLCVGDIVDGAGDVNRCCELLREHDVQTVRGNHDRWLFNNEMRVLADAHAVTDLSPSHAEWLSSVPTVLDFTTPHGKLLLCHGLGANDMKTLLPDDTGYALQCNEAVERLLSESDYRYVLSGHSHRRMVRRIDNVTFVNAGTLRRMNDPCFCVIDFV